MVDQLEARQPGRKIGHVAQGGLNVVEGLSFIQYHPVEFIFIWDSVALTVFGAYKLAGKVKSEPYDVEAHNREAFRRMAQEEQLEETDESVPMMARESEPVRITSVPDRPSWMN